MISMVSIPGLNSIKSEWRFPCLQILTSILSVVLLTSAILTEAFWNFKDLFLHFPIAENNEQLLRNFIYLMTTASLEW